MLYKNIDEERRVWPNIAVPPSNKLETVGHTLELGAGEEVDLDLPEDFTDEYLQPVETGTKAGAISSSDVLQSATISVQNLSSVISDEAAQAIVVALGTQATQDYNKSCWVTQNLATAIAVVLFLKEGEAVPSDTWHMEILDTSDQPGAVGYHEEEAFDNQLEGKNSGFAGPTKHPRKASARSSRGLRADNPELPLMKIFAKTAAEDRVSLSEVASHEMLEAAVDPCPMREPRTVTNSKAGKVVIVEVGDPVQECGYEVDGLVVADFALPAWFGYPQVVSPDQMSFRSSVHEPFELAPGGYISETPESEPENWTQVFGTPQPAEESQI
jgi:hypothetical protein